MFAEALGVIPFVGTSAIFGGLEGVVLGEETGAENEGPFVNGFGVGETMGSSGLVGDFFGAMEGDLTGEIDNDFIDKMGGDFVDGFEMGE